jgi:pyocin large subunit-like protein
MNPQKMGAALMKKIVLLGILIAIILFQKGVFSHNSDTEIHEQNTNSQVIQNTNNQLSWSKGTVGNAEKNLAQHYQKHAREVGAESVGDYYQKANDALDPKNGYIKILRTDGKTDYFNPETRLLVGLSTSGAISTFHKVVHPAKLQRLLRESAN